MNRSEMREQAFILLFEKEFFKDKPLDEIEDVFSENVSALSDYAKELFETTFNHISELDEIIEICDEHGVPLIEDAAESLSSTYKGKHTGTFGKIGIYSFNGNKIITTSGGGMLVCSLEEEKAKALEKGRTGRTIRVLIIGIPNVRKIIFNKSNI